MLKFCQITELFSEKCCMERKSIAVRPIVLIRCAIYRTQYILPAIKQSVNPNLVKLVIN